MESDFRIASKEMNRKEEKSQQITHHRAMMTLLPHKSIQQCTKLILSTEKKNQKCNSQHDRAGMEQRMNAILS